MQDEYGLSASQGKPRDRFIDLIKGIAVLNIVVIHTTFWSGESYVPNLVKSLSLMIDMPLFFFMSGWGAGMSKEMGDIIKVSKRLATGIFGKSIFCTAVLAIVTWLFGTPYITSWQTLLSTCALVFRFNGNEVLNGSYWFFAYYLRAVFLNQLAIAVLKPYAAGRGYSEESILKFLLGVNITLFLMSCASVYYLPVSLNSTDFLLSTMWLLGALAVKTRFEIRSIWALAGSVALAIACFFVTALLANADVMVVQSMKLPVTPDSMIPYFFFSLVTILGTLYLRTKKKLHDTMLAKVIAHVGKNAIFFFFAQGISSMYIYNFMSWPMPNWYTKLLVMVSLNICIAVAVAESLVLSEKLFVLVVNKLRIKM